MLNKNLLRCVCLAGSMLIPMPAQALEYADVFKWLDTRGRSHYSDREQESARILTVAPRVAYYVVKKVFDGDTILLSNGQKIRLLGINTPEVAGPNKQAEAGGEEAKAWLKKTLEQKKVRLEGDVEKQDKYRRSLAYVFTEDKQHINLELVRQGWAAVNIYPPNLKYVDTLLEAQLAAEKAGLGIWADPAYAPRAFQTLSEANYKGWKRITGRIASLKKTRKYSYLKFSEQVTLRIENQSSALFPALQDYVGKNVEARGWVHKSKDSFSIQLQHPGELKVF